MKITQLPRDSVAERAVASLGLEQDVIEIGSVEAVCALLRRVASFVCPASPRELADAVLDVLGPLLGDEAPSRDDINAQLDLLIASGDLLELREGEGRAARRLYLGPPSYVIRTPGRYLLLGVRPYGAPLVDSDLSGRIEYEGHTRTLQIEPEDAATRLAVVGMRELSLDQWLQRPVAATAAELLADVRVRLSAARPAGEIPGLTLIDPAESVRFYKGRWRGTKLSDDGDFIGRREQAYGADLWCVVRLQAGQPVTLLDLPVAPAANGRDEAWRLQAAIDAERGTPQLYRVQEAAVGTAVLVDFFSPLPTWAERRLELVGMPVSRARGALLTYRLPERAIDAVEEFLTEMLWMTRLRKDRP